jgi:hypothetical protein
MAESPSSDRRGQPRAGPPGDFQAVSRRIAGWTTNGLATALVLLAGLSLGRQVLIWWKEAPPEAPPMTAAPGEPDGPVELEFGGLGQRVQTRTVEGDRQAVLAALRMMCRPAQGAAAGGDRPVGPAERALLADAARKAPAETGRGWRIDELDQEFPLVLCSTQPGKDVAAADGTAQAARILAIGLALPAEEDQWRLYAFDLEGSGAADEARDFGLPLPPGCRRVLTLRQADGRRLACIAGGGELREWVAFFRRELPQQGWQAAHEGKLTDGRWQGKFIYIGARIVEAEIHIAPSAPGKLRGLLVVSRQPPLEY